MAEIVLKGGAVALVDDADLPLVEGHKWYLSTSGYAVTVHHRKGCGRGDKNRNVNIAMHRLLTGFPAGVVDHRNRIRLDNRRSNLRVVTYTENGLNKTSTGGASGFIGVKQESANSYVARVGGATIGYYDTAEKAAMARDIAALAASGGSCPTNFDPNSLPDFVEPLPPRNVGERTSAVRGVSYSRKRRAKSKWRAVKNKQHLGWFLTEDEAIVALESFNASS